ncbi:hypothetical protein [Chloroflexus sp.]|uniref:hypothetical protein n=1 Tax=Chloroflexus sp. TaxID=1904827 RepID=UPI002ACD2A53|nr:hypothetical protein [Chloroflexus sp.]
MQPTFTDALTATLKADTTCETWAWACPGVCGSAQEAARADLLRVVSAWPTCRHCSARMALRVELERSEWWMHKQYQVLPEQNEALLYEEEGHDLQWGGGSVQPEHRAIDYAFTRARFAVNDVRAAIPAKENTPERQAAFYSVVCAFAWAVVNEAKAGCQPADTRAIDGAVAWIFSHRRRQGLAGLDAERGRS